MQGEIDWQLLAYAIGGIGIIVEWRAYGLTCGLVFRCWSAQYFLLDAWTAGLTMAFTALRTLLSSHLA